MNTKNKNIFIVFILILSFFACSDSKNSDTNYMSESSSELYLRKKISNTISTKGEVDWYHFKADQVGSILEISCTSNTYRPDVDLLVTAFEDDNTSDKKIRKRLYADHAPENGLLPADIKMNLFIDKPKDIYLSVRDLMDDDFSNNPYYLMLNYLNIHKQNDSDYDNQEININDLNSCKSGYIEYVGDTDSFFFEVSNESIFEIIVEFNTFQTGTDVELSIELYDNNSSLISTISQFNALNYSQLVYLASGKYFLLINDFGKNNYDISSKYNVCINKVSGQELNENDNFDNADDLGILTNSPIQINANLEYNSDIDFYNFHIPSNDLLQIINLKFNDLSNSYIKYQIDIFCNKDIKILSHKYSGEIFEKQINAACSNYYLYVSKDQKSIISNPISYSFNIQLLTVDDPEELAIKNDIFSGNIETGNNTIGTSKPLSKTQINDLACKGKIAYIGDIDWYSIQIDNPEKNHILEVFFENLKPGPVEYALSIMRDNVIKRLIDWQGQDNATKLKTGIMIPSNIEYNEPLNYYIKVYDFQGDDSDAESDYYIRANYIEIPETLPYSILATNYCTIENPIYYWESHKNENLSLTLENKSGEKNNYFVNTSYLDFNNPDVLYEKINDNSVNISFPWIGGYIDYQGDQDWFQIYFGKLNNDLIGLSENWYYEIKILFYSPGSNVEYVWKLYRNNSQNYILVERENNSNGFFASAGDLSTDIEEIYFETPLNDLEQNFWIGDQWKGYFYFNISDFDYVHSENPDNDWGYDNPYYFKIILLYHNDKSYPEDK